MGSCFITYLRRRWGFLQTALCRTAHLA